METVVMSQQLAKTQGPSEEEWLKHRETIETLYLTDSKTLTEVQRLMQRHHNFKATRSMYRKRLYKWNVFKNWKSQEKTEMIVQLASRSLLSPSYTMQLNIKDQRRLKRHVKTLTAASRGNPDNLELNKDTLTLSKLSEFGRNEIVLDTTSCPSQQSDGVDGLPPLPNQQEDHLVTIYKSLGNDPQSSSAQLVFKTVFDFACSADGHMTLSGSKSPFWDKLGLGVYFFKVYSPRQAWPAINTACEIAATEIKLGAGMFIIGLLTTLSPVNTALCSSLRTSILGYITHLADCSLGKDHPLTILARELRTQGAQYQVSDSALSCLLDGLTMALGPTHHLTLTAQLRRIAFLRRSHEYERALKLGRATLDVTTASYGPTSLYTRRGARQLEHVYMDMESWNEALSVCFEIVGPVDDTGSPTEATLKDDCGVSTMEDIAKIYEHMGNPDKSITWLMQAAISASSLWGSTQETAHIVDKLECLLVKNGRVDEGHIWRRLAPGSLRLS
ncbi:Clr5 domain-containing protein [Xylariaceae sp. FL0662B]|nr:Clr5 domain-containing protein [Xylariaceae sp. FL0662B]